MRVINPENTEFNGAQVLGIDVIGQQKCGITKGEAVILVDCADGLSNSAIEKKHGMDKLTLLSVMKEIKRKIGAENKAHMITKAFVTGVLIPNILTICLYIIWFPNSSIDMPRRGGRPTRTSQVRGRSSREFA